MVHRRIYIVRTERPREMIRLLTHELKAPWSDDSLHVLKSRLFDISAPPPKPSLKLIAACNNKVRINSHDKWEPKECHNGREHWRNPPVTHVVSSAAAYTPVPSQ